MGPAEFQAAGLYDPVAPNAADRLALLEWLAARGVTLEQMQQAAGEGGLLSLAGDLVRQRGPKLTLAELAARIGVTTEELQEILLAAGLPPNDPDVRGFSADDPGSLAGFFVASRLFGAEPTKRVLRVIGSSLARIAEATVSLYYVTIETPLRQEQSGELALAQGTLRAVEALAVVPRTIDNLFRSHMELAIRRLRQARAGTALDTGRFAVGFVDLVGFTPLSSRVPTQELADLVARFEDTAHDVATARDGRVVKLIGDEVMFVAIDPGAACDIALTLMERLCCDTTATPRGGLAFGDMLLRGGDYYGPVVNLAARIAEQAVPNELLVTPELAAHARRPGLRFEPAGKRMLKGFDAAVALMTVERA